MHKMSRWHSDITVLCLFTSCVEKGISELKSLHAHTYICLYIYISINPSRKKIIKYVTYVLTRKKKQIKHLFSEAIYLLTLCCALVYMLKIL